MGRDKAAIPLGDATMLERVVSVVRQVADPVVIVAATPESYRIPGAETVGDLYPGEGPVGGIITGLRALGPGAHLAVACDMPLLVPGLLRYLLDLADPEMDAVAAEIYGGLEPLCAVYRDTALPSLEAFLASGRRSAQAAAATLNLRRVGHEEIARFDPELLSFTNVNTAEELTRLKNR
jgi:molybdopterin-guanine dinucleotide biosynthesis protein A